MTGVKLLTTQEAAERLAEQLGESAPIHISVVTYWCRKGYIDGAQKVGRDWVIPETAIAGFKRPQPTGWPKGKSRKQALEPKPASQPEEAE